MAFLSFDWIFYCSFSVSSPNAEKWLTAISNAIDATVHDAMSKVNSQGRFY
jgi:hypothetical protein